MSVSVGDIYVSMGVDMSSFTAELSKAEQIAQGSTQKIQDRFKAVAGSLADLRTQSKMVKESLSGAADFRVRGQEALEKLHGELAKVRDAGGATESTLDKLSLSFEMNARGARTYVQALEKIASDKGASQSVRDLAKALADEAREANFDVVALEKRGRALDQMITKQSRTFSSLRRQLEPTPAEPSGGGHGRVPDQAAASATARLVEGQVSIRAAERFLTNVLHLGPALQAIFPLVGGLAFLDLLGGLVDRAERLYETFKKLQEAPARINQEFGELNQTLLVGNDQLRVSNDRLENEIAKLEGKPQNGLKLALDEAAAAADNLAQSLGHDIDQLQKLLEQEQIGALKGFFTGNAPTTQITEANKKLQNDLVQINIRTEEQLRNVTDPAERARIAQQGIADSRARVQRDREAAEKEFAEAQKRQARHTAPAEQGVAGGLALSTAGEAPRLGQDAGAELAMAGRRLDTLLQIEARFPLSEQNQKLTQKKEKLEQAGAGQTVINPFGDKMNELAAQIEAARSELDAIGKSDTAEVLAKSWGKAQESIAKLNNELAKHHQSLTLEQQISILTEEDTIALTHAEVEWKTKLDQTTDSITNRITALKLLTGAIGKGAAATRQAAIESQVIQTLGTKYQDPEFMRTHAADVAEIRKGAAAQFDAEHAQRSAQNLDKLTDQIDLERSLALVQSRGAEAVRLQTLAYQLRNMAMAGATQKEIQAQFDLAEAQRKNQSAANVASLDQRIDATQRLSAAQLQGAEATRQTQLQLKYEQMQRQGASPEEIQKTRTVDTLQHSQQITEEALRTAMSYRNQLESVDEQITAVEQLRAQWGNTRDIEISLKTLEEERVHILGQQALAVGTARDGMVAFFREMATEAESSAQMVHDAFASAFNGINDQLSKLMTGQKTSWASFLQSLGAQISKMALMSLEHEVAGKILGTLGGSRQQQAGGTNPVNQPAAQHGIAAALGHIFGGTLKRDGNTPATALFVTMTGANGIPMWSTPGTSAGGFDMSDFGISSADLNQLEYGGSSGSTAAAAETLANGAAKSTPGVGGEILSAAAKVAEAFINHLHSSKSESSSSSSSTSSTGASGTSGSPAPGAQPGDILTRDPSGLIIRTPAPTAPDQRSMTTLDNGARPKPSVWGEIGKASLQLFQAWLAYSSSSGGDGGGGDGGGGEEVDSTITYHAKGGRPRVGKVSVVGEKGPELFVPDTAGTIIPNHKLASVMGKPFGGFRAAGGSVDPSKAYMVGERGPEAFASIGAPGYDGASAQPYQIVNYSIDARGTDPVLTEQRTRAAIVAAHQSAIVNSVQTTNERAKRQPQK